jgi:hypothetical protein
MRRRQVRAWVKSIMNAADHDVLIEGTSPVKQSNTEARTEEWGEAEVGAYS